MKRLLFHTVYRMDGRYGFWLYFVVRKNCGSGIIQDINHLSMILEHLIATPKPRNIYIIHWQNGSRVAASLAPQHVPSPPLKNTAQHSWFDVKMLRTLNECLTGALTHVPHTRDACCDRGVHHFFFSSEFLDLGA